MLGFESSCDETACAVTNGTEVLSNVVASQIPTHAKFGGVVPELASREHLESIWPCMRSAIEESGIDPDQLDGIAVTEGPGLVGALLISVQAARAYGAAMGKPVYGIHHLEGHVYSVYLDQENKDSSSEPLAAHLALLVSGGHTMLVDARGPGEYVIVGTSRDDAVGEAFDKAAKMLGIGYPGGPVIDRLAAQGDPKRFKFPRAMLAPRDNLEFSFSGLKTSMFVHLQREGQPDSRQALMDLCASYQEAIVDVLLEKTRRALKLTGHRRVHVVGGVAANSVLRSRFTDLCAQRGLEFRAAPLKYCGDNAAMVALAGQRQALAGLPAHVDVHTNRSIEDVLR